MSRQRRVAVTSPQTRVALTRRRAGAPRSQQRLSPAEAALARRLRAQQLRWALGTLALACLLLVGVPLTLAAVPVPGALRIAGVPLSWLAVATFPYPVLAGLAFWQLRRAERAEDRS